MWTGITGHGKSDFLGMLTLYAADDGQIAMIASMELKGAHTYGRQVIQATGTQKPALIELHKAVDWLDERIYLYAVHGRADPDDLVASMIYARRRFGASWFVIDSLMKCGIASDDYRGQGEFVDRLTKIAEELDIHIHLVAHPAKPKDENKPVGKLLIKGSGEMMDLAHNTIEIFRNKAKERKKAEDLQKYEDGDLEAGKHADGLNKQYDTMMICDKQRGGIGSWEGIIYLWFNTESRTWGTGPYPRPMELATFKGPSTPEPQEDEIPF